MPIRQAQDKQKITPFLWFEDKAEEAVDFYVSIFKNSKIGSVARYDAASSKASGRPEGSVMTVDFELEGQDFVALNGGPYFEFTPAVSLTVNCQTREELDGLWEKLFDGGTVLMELGKYPFSERYGWLNDKFGMSWQLNLAETEQKIIPFLMFVGEKCGKAEEAMNFYVSIFRNSKIGDIFRYGKGEYPDKEGTVKHSTFFLGGQEFMAMDSAADHQFSFSGAVSFVINCSDQEEVDYFWEKLSEGGEPGVCGWINYDKFGVTWQVTPVALIEMIHDPDPEKAKRVMESMLQMEKIDIGKLKDAYENKK
ncbi:MAG TPA: hypothetical protein DCX32_04160 [Candidatus Moranbacteria bacterium]|nr:MAG: 3-demethylubiquinone-9 3-methyltransferase [Candidatus Moranbacteria bacterium GW2011_GWC2_45_10]KKT93068.1 MAG: 3-demethylubiquinone-9 3-methyltransferase [Parcubacteria group bacterium GW2011_GWC1_45_14]HAV11701.1 hypothetical protein [Candidatus Moranbacteria bacterium]